MLIETYKYVRSDGISKCGAQRSKATVNRELSALSKIFELAIRERITVENPVRLVKKFKEDNARIRYFKPDDDDDEEEDLEEAIDFAPSYLKSFVILTRHTGMRSGEALNLKIKQVDNGPSYSTKLSVEYSVGFR
ncbi:MAG: hypothetical protein J2P21_25435 [Chloracidobacterium sp.]|nr:hypothetical protein [Chloracidobacterium sp.]